jgi:hypothetical protein
VGDRDKIMYGEDEIYFVLGRQEQPRKNKNLLYRQDKRNEPSNKVPLSFESPFTSVSTVGRSHPSLVSLFTTEYAVQYYAPST